MIFVCFFVVENFKSPPLSPLLVRRYEYFPDKMCIIPRKIYMRHLTEQGVKELLGILLLVGEAGDAA